MKSTSITDFRKSQKSSTMPFFLKNFFDVINVRNTNDLHCKNVRVLENVSCRILRDPWRLRQSITRPRSRFHDKYRTWNAVSAVGVVGAVPETAVLTGRPGLDGRRVSAQRHRVGVPGLLRVPVRRFGRHPGPEHGEFSFHLVVVPGDKYRNHNNTVAPSRKS